MTFPEDRVLVGVINTKRDLALARDEHWYRIPQEKMKRGIYTEYVAFFLSGAVFKDLSGSIAYYARYTGGLELLRRRDLIPKQPDHARADRVYYRLSIGELQTKEPPIRNEENYKISFIFTTWDRFVSARTIRDLYSTGDYFVDRIYHSLRKRNLPVERFWEAERKQTGHAPHVRILCQRGEVVASTESGHGNIFLDASRPDDAILAEIQAAIASHDGPHLINLPQEGI